MLSHHLGALTTMRGQASDLGSNWLLTRNLNFTRDYLAAIQTVTEADVLRLTEKYFTRQNLSITSLNPKGALGLKRESAQPALADEIQKFTLSNGLRIL